LRCDFEVIPPINSFKHRLNCWFISASTRQASCYAWGSVKSFDLASPIASRTFAGFFSNVFQTVRRMISFSSIELWHYNIK